MIEIQAMFPVMVAENLEELKKFYEIYFGFTSVFYDPNFYLHLVNQQNGIQLGFLLPSMANQPDFLHPLMVPDGYVISFEVQKAAEAYLQAQELKLDIAMPLKEEVWGQVHFMVSDPAGFKIDIVEHISE